MIRHARHLPILFVACAAGFGAPAQAVTQTASVNANVRSKRVQGFRKTRNASPRIIASSTPGAETIPVMIIRALRGWVSRHIRKNSIPGVSGMD